jgi:hypothetical protein
MPFPEPSRKEVSQFRVQPHDILYKVSRDIPYTPAQRARGWRRSGARRPEQRFERGQPNELVADRLQGTQRMAAADAFASGCGSYESRVSIWDRSAVNSTAQFMAMPTSPKNRSGKKKLRGGRFWLQLGAGVRVDFAVQANFFKSRCCPLHDEFPHSIVRRADRERGVSIADRWNEINSPAKNFELQPRAQPAFLR